MSAGVEQPGAVPETGDQNASGETERRDLRTEEQVGAAEETADLQGGTVCPRLSLGEEGQELVLESTGGGVDQDFHLSASESGEEAKTVQGTKEGDCRLKRVSLSELVASAVVTPLSPTLKQVAPVVEKSLERSRSVKDRAKDFESLFRPLPQEPSEDAQDPDYPLSPEFLQGKAALEQRVGQSAAMSSQEGHAEEPVQHSETGESKLPSAARLSNGVGALTLAETGESSGDANAGAGQSQVSPETVEAGKHKGLGNGAVLAEVEGVYDLSSPRDSDAQSLDAPSWLGNNEKLEAADNLPEAKGKSVLGRPSSATTKGAVTTRSLAKGDDSARGTTIPVGSQNRSAARPASGHSSRLAQTQHGVTKKGGSSDPAYGRKTPRPASASASIKPRRLSLGPTVAKPFNFATEKRPQKSEAASSSSQPSSGRITPRAGVVPSTLKEPKVPPKPAVKQPTAPKPFNLASIRRHEEAMEKQKAELAAKAAEEEQQRLFKAQPVKQADPFVPAKGVLPTTKPAEFRFSVDERASKWSEIKSKQEEVEAKKEEQRQKELMEKQAQEEKEALEAKKAANFKATPVKYVPPEKVWQPVKVRRPPIKTHAPQLGPKKRISGSSTPSESGSVGDQQEPKTPPTTRPLKESPAKSFSPHRRSLSQTDAQMPKAPATPEAVPS